VASSRSRPRAGGRRVGGSPGSAARRAVTGVASLPGADLPARRQVLRGAVPRTAGPAPAPRRDDGLDVLDIHLEAMVPLRILELRQAGEAERMRLAREAAEQIASHGDDILFRAARRGATASAVSWLVTGLAVGAFQPGGVRFRNLAWCAAHLGRRRAAGETVCAACLSGDGAGDAVAAT
jgi:hypothetical protein